MVVKESLQFNNSSRQDMLCGLLSVGHGEADSQTACSEVEDGIFHMEDLVEGRDNGHPDEVAVVSPPENIDLVKSAALPSRISQTQSKAVADDADRKEKTGNVSSLAGTKRPRTDEEPSVRIIYSFLPRSSKKKLEELLNCWSEWHAQNCSSMADPMEDASEFGEETYFPALHVGGNKSAIVCFRMDNQLQKRQCEKSLSLENECVPVYDRDYSLGLTPDGKSIDYTRPLDLREASRCFNCGSYNHSLKECPKPYDNVTVSNARKEYQSKKSKKTGPRLPIRYYQNSPGGKYDGLKPGNLAAETREALGLRELDPPPWLNRMRQLGYPPGYLDLEDEDQPSGLAMYGEEQTCNASTNGTKPDISGSRKKMSVDFPGLNAPIPENADHKPWVPLQGPAVDSETFPKPFDMNRIYHSPDPTTSTGSWGQNYIGAPSPRYGHGSSLLIPNHPISHYNSTPRYSSHHFNPIPSMPDYGGPRLHAGWPSYPQRDSSPNPNSPAPGSHMIQNLWHLPVLGSSFPGQNL